MEVGVLKLVRFLLLITLDFGVDRMSLCCDAEVEDDRSIACFLGGVDGKVSPIVYSGDEGI